MSIVRSLLGAVDLISDWAAKMLSFLILAIMAVILYEVILRGVFDSPTNWAHESSGYIFGAYFMIGGVYALRHGDHVNVDILYSRFSPRLRAVINIIAAIMLFLLLTVLIWKGWDSAITSIGRNEVSQTLWAPPVYPLKLTIAVGASLIALQGLTKFVRDCFFAITGRELA